MGGVPNRPGRRAKFHALQAAGRDRPIRGHRRSGTRPGSASRRRQRAAEIRGSCAYAATDAISSRSAGVSPPISARWTPNSLTATFDAAHGGGPVFVASKPRGFARPNGTLFQSLRIPPLRHSRPEPTSTPGVMPLAGEFVSPLARAALHGSGEPQVAHQIEPLDLAEGGLRPRRRPQPEPSLRPNAFIGGQRYLGGSRFQPTPSWTPYGGQQGSSAATTA